MLIYVCEPIAPCYCGIDVNEKEILNWVESCPLPRSPAALQSLSAIASAHPGSEQWRVLNTSVLLQAVAPNLDW